MKISLKIFAVISFFCFFAIYVNAQGIMYKSSGHYIAVLDFFNNHPLKNTKGRIIHPNPEANGLTNTANKWYEANGIKVKGLLNSAALQVDWWLLFDEPTEQYEFQWASSGSYDIVYADKNGKSVTATISEAKLEKYPDLLKRFKALKPTNIDLEINWRIGDQSSSDRLAFQQKYNLLGSIGSEMPHVKKGFITTVKGSGLLFEPSGIKPLAVPGIRSGKGQEFLGLAPNYDSQKLSQVFNYFKISTGHNINGFRAIKMSWSVGEMKAIAEKFASYENGEEKPKDKVAKAEEEIKNTKAYNKDDFWGDATEDLKIETFKESGTVGLRRNGSVIISSEKHWYVIDLGKKSKFFLFGGHSDYFITDASGNKISFDGNSSFNKFIESTKEGGKYLVLIRESGTRVVDGYAYACPEYMTKSGYFTSNSQLETYKQDVRRKKSNLDFQPDGWVYHNGMSGHDVYRFKMFVLDENLKSLKQEQVYAWGY